MPYFDRFDICEAYALLEYDYNIGGILIDRPSCRRRNKGNGESVAAQLHRIKYYPGPFADQLTENGREIYNAAAQRFKLPQTCQRCTIRQTDPEGIGYAAQICEKCATARLNAYAQ